MKIMHTFPIMNCEFYANCLSLIYAIFLQLSQIPVGLRRVPEVARVAGYHCPFSDSAQSAFPSRGLCPLSVGQICRKLFLIQFDPRSFVEDDGRAVLYCFEIQVERDYQQKGAGTLLLELLKRLGKRRENPFKLYTYRISD
jgi:hypothetical protein